MLHKKYFFYIFVAAFVVGQVFTFFIFQPDVFQKQTADIKNKYNRRGIIKFVDNEQKYFFLEYRDLYEFFKTRIIKIYFDNKVVIEEKNVLLENGVVFSESFSIQHTKTDIVIGSRVSVTFTDRDKKFYAQRVVYGVPFPEI